MKLLNNTILIVAITFFAFTWHSRSISANKPLVENKNNTATGFALVELFTSEGCYSCPPADKLLSEITNEAQKSGQPVYTLSFHVDYWNYIGWTDPYSRAEFSQRQRRYSQVFGSDRIYTPQMVVNGEAEFVGSIARKAKSAIASALKKPTQIMVNISEIQTSAGILNITYSVESLPKNAVINVALVERDLHQNVKRGENSGKKLKHDNVVRAFEVFASREASVQLGLEDEIDLAKSSVIVYMQDSETMSVLGATQKQFTSTTSSK